MVTNVSVESALCVPASSLVVWEATAVFGTLLPGMLLLVVALASRLATGCRLLVVHQGPAEAISFVGHFLVIDGF